MNKLLFILLLLTTTLAAQPGHEGHQRGERSERLTAEQRAERFAKIKTARQAYITEELELSPKQATAFFPVYWNYEQRLNEARKDTDRRKRGGQEARELTEKEARAELLNRRTNRQKMIALHQEAEDQYLKILPATKVLRLPEVERAFRKKLWERTRKHKRD